jgi:hypothetical protein
MKSAKREKSFFKLTEFYSWDDDTRRNLSILLEGELQKVRQMFSDAELDHIFHIRYEQWKADDGCSPVKELKESETFDRFHRLNGGMKTALILLMLEICKPTDWAKYDNEVQGAVKSAFSFSKILIPAVVNWSEDLYFVTTGPNASPFDTDWMLDIPLKKNLKRGIVYSHLSDRVETCYDELKIKDPFPPYTLMLAFRRSRGGYLRLLDLRRATLNIGLDDLPPVSRISSSAMIKKNARFLEELDCDGILQCSDPNPFDHKYVALTGNGLSSLVIIENRPLGDPSPVRTVDHDAIPF